MNDQRSTEEEKFLIDFYELMVCPFIGKQKRIDLIKKYAKSIKTKNDDWKIIGKDYL